MNISWPHAVAVWQRNFAMYRRTWKLNLLPNFFEPVFYLLAIGVGVGSYVNEMAGMSYAEFLAPGLVCVAAMNGASFEVTYNVYVRLNFDKTYDAMLTSPISVDDILVGELLWAMTRVMIYGGSFLLIAMLFGLAPLPSSLLALPIIPLTGLLFATLGLAFTLRIPNIDLFSFYFTLFLTPLFLFSDVFFPIAERLSPGLQWVAELLPLVHPVRLTRAAFQGELDPHWLFDITYVLALSCVLLYSASRTIRKRLGA